MPNTPTSGIQPIPPADLRFDSRNPRLVEFVGSNGGTQEELLSILWKEMGVEEVAMSIAADGFWPYEPLIVSEEGGEKIVIEGNRRLAAVRLLIDEDLRTRLKATDLPEASPKIVTELRNGLPVIFQSRKEAWRYLGFKHVNGPAKWDSYPKAQYIAQVHNEYNVPLSQIADQIGDRHQTVQRLYRALMVIEQAERKGVYSREYRAKKHFSFSHLYTGLEYPAIESFLDLCDADAEKADPVPNARLKQLGELCRWLYGDNRDNVPPLVQSQNPDLRILADVLESEHAVSTLREGMPLSLAHDVSKGDDTIFRQSLTQAKIALQRAHSTLSTGYSGDPSELRLANEINDLAYDLAEQMEHLSKARRRKKPRSRID